MFRNTRSHRAKWGQSNKHVTMPFRRLTVGWILLSAAIATVQSSNSTTDNSTTSALTTTTTATSVISTGADNTTTTSSATSTESQSTLGATTMTTGGLTTAAVPPTSTSSASAQTSTTSAAVSTAPSGNSGPTSQTTASSGSNSQQNGGGQTCSTPLGIANGQIVTSGPYYGGAVVTFQCLYGFKMNGTPSQTCDGATLSWKGTQPTCNVMTETYDWFLLYVIGGGVGGLLCIIVFFLMFATCYWMCCRKTADGRGSGCCSCCDRQGRTRKQRSVSVTPSPRNGYSDYPGSLQGKPRQSRASKWDSPRTTVTHVSEAPRYESPSPPPPTSKPNYSKFKTKPKKAGSVAKTSWVAKQVRGKNK